MNRCYRAVHFQTRSTAMQQSKTGKSAPFRIQAYSYKAIQVYIQSVKKYIVAAFVDATQREI